MKVLIVGSGGREHAIAWKISQSELVDELYCIPGNGGISRIAKCVNININDFDSIIKFAKENTIDYTIIGMDEQLVNGIVDEFKNNGLAVFGPDKRAAIIEGSKSYSKKFMKKYNIPTASYEIFNEHNSAIEYIRSQNFPLVIKADGLAAGKGVLICNTYDEAENALREMFINKKFGNAGNSVVIEEFLEGIEVSVLAFCDGKTIVPMVSAQDHKRIYDNDEGLNTGGMGSISPSKYYSDEISKQCMKQIYKPTLDGLIKENRIFKGVIFFGLMLTKDGPKVVEYNARFGDPETQVVLPRLKNDLLEIMIACTNGTLDTLDIKWDNNASACVIMASGGYPGKYDIGFEIKGLESIEEHNDTIIFHAGTNISEGKFFTSGGRVLGVTSIARDLQEAIEKAYNGVIEINFEKAYYRHDIGKK